MGTNKGLTRAATRSFCPLPAPLLQAEHLRPVTHSKVRKMRFYSHLFLLLILITRAAWATPFDHRLFDQILSRYVDEVGCVDYSALQAARDSLDAYTDSLALVSPHSQPDRFPTPRHELAYWINAYNAFVLRGVLDAYPVDSVKDIMLLGGFFRRLKFTAGNEQFTLNQLENDIIRPVYQDPRIHFAVNCGAMSCPQLGNRAFTGENLDTRLDSALTRFAHSPQHVSVDRQQGKLHLSKILDWYGKDFVEWFPQDRLPAQGAPTLVDYLLPYLPAADAAYLRAHPQTSISFNDYDWTLNDQTPARP